MVADHGDATWSRDWPSKTGRRQPWATHLRRLAGGDCPLEVALEVAAGLIQPGIDFAKAGTLSTPPCRRAPGCGIDDVCPRLVYRSRPRLGGATARNPGAPPRRPVVTERASGRAPAARSHTPNHYVGLWDRVAVT